MNTGMQKRECCELSDAELGSVVGGKDSGLVRLGKEIAEAVQDGLNHARSPKSLTHY